MFFNNIFSKYSNLAFGRRCFYYAPYCQRHRRCHMVYPIIVLTPQLCPTPVWNEFNTNGFGNFDLYNGNKYDYNMCNTNNVNNLANYEGSCLNLSF
jgi:hypothetical protein